MGRPRKLGEGPPPARSHTARARVEDAPGIAWGRVVLVLVVVIVPMVIHMLVRVRETRAVNALGDAFNGMRDALRENTAATRQSGAPSSRDTGAPIVPAPVANDG